LIVSISQPPELYDLYRDTRERNDLTSDVRRVLALARQLGDTIAMNYALGAQLRRDTSVKQRRDSLDSRTVEQLKALGYVE
jgi:hypothetical protein